jgi:hypothetical protein
VLDIRRRANEAHSRYVLWRLERAPVTDRTLVIARHWSGSVQQFYHYLLGYALPLGAWVEKTGTREVAVRDCGPMNPWFEMIGGSVDIKILAPPGALNWMVGRRTPSVVVEGMDHPLRFKRSRLVAGRDAWLRLAGVAPVEPGSSVLVIDRASSDPFYHGPGAENPMSGSERRSVPNLAEIIGRLDVRVPVTIRDLAGMTPVDQIELLRGVGVLVGQHGAGLAHMVWMAPGSTIVEIKPPLPPVAVETFERLAKCLGHTYIVVPQSDPHAPVVEADVRSALVAAGVPVAGPQVPTG